MWLSVCLSDAGCLLDRVLASTFGDIDAAFHARTSFGSCLLGAAWFQ